MTDQQTHTDPAGNRLSLIHRAGGALEVRVNHRVTVPAPVVILDTIALLRMIDRLDPDAMRAYLRETTPELEDDTTPEPEDDTTPEPEQETTR